ncbi:MAG: copper homeostasis protein CutC [Prevotella sp.]|nr:copper homeostasis protein CutC [Prevotella sp.]
MSQQLFEVCANSVESCIAAQQGGADRVELCAGIPEGGTTPSYGEILLARRVLDEGAQQGLKPTRLHVIIRPRGGDFLYSDLEIERMVADIRICRELGADGVVFGCLRPDGTLDTEANAKLMKAAKDVENPDPQALMTDSQLSVTFHRAFDRCANPVEALEELIAQGFNRVLTSGQQPTAELGIPLLRQLQVQAKGRINILAGCGVNEQNICRIHKETGVNEFHFSAREPMKSRMEFSNPDVYMGAKGADEDTILQTTARRVRNTILAISEEL